MELNPSSKLKNYEIPIFSNYILDGRKKIKSDEDTDIYCGIETNTKEKVIFKLKKNNYFDYHYIFKESLIYKELAGIKRIPKMYEVGKQGEYSILITESLGPSLKMLLESVGGTFSLATTLKVCTQVLKIVKTIHKKGVVLRYLKPSNMVIGRDENKNYIYLIDFEIAKKYIKNGEHIPFSEDKLIKGNRHYISINTHNELEISRRDDIESLGYNLIYFMKGKLPWSHIYDSDMILDKKIDTNLDVLCEGLPEEFKEFIKYARELEFEQEPDYNYLKELLIKAGEKNGIDIDKVKYDWEIKKEKIKKENKNLKEQKKIIQNNKIKEDEVINEKELIIEDEIIKANENAKLKKYRKINEDSNEKKIKTMIGKKKRKTKFE